MTKLEAEVFQLEAEAHKMLLYISDNTPPKGKTLTWCLKELQRLRGEISEKLSMKNPVPCAKCGIVLDINQPVFYFRAFVTGLQLVAPDNNSVEVRPERMPNFLYFCEGCKPFWVGEEEEWQNQ